jgi:hypothetical protein
VIWSTPTPITFNVSLHSHPWATTPAFTRHSSLKMSRLTLNPGPRARIRLNSVNTYSEPGNWCGFILSGCSPLASVRTRRSRTHTITNCERSKVSEHCGVIHCHVISKTIDEVWIGNRIWLFDTGHVYSSQVTITHVLTSVLSHVFIAIAWYLLPTADVQLNLCSWSVSTLRYQLLTATAHSGCEQPPSSSSTNSSLTEWLTPLHCLNLSK